LYFFKFSHLKQAFLEESLIPMSFSFKSIIMLDKSVKKYNWKMIQYYNSFLYVISTSTGSAWYNAKILHHPYVYNCYFTKSQGCYQGYLYERLLSYWLWVGTSAYFLECISWRSTGQLSWVLSWHSSVSLANFGIQPEIRPKHFLLIPFQFIIH
jgi:hypothetical protein